MSDTSTGHALVDDTAAAIRAKIMSGEIPIGAQLRQGELAKSLGVSRTPVREALRQLQAGGLIEVVPNRGAVVRVPVPWEVREAYEVRAELEALACERAVDRITDDALEELRRTNRVLRESHSEPSETGRPAASTLANDRFHTLIHEAAGNERLSRVIGQLNETFPRNVSAMVLQDNSRHREDNLHEHEQIVAAIEAGDHAAAREAMRRHVLSAGEQLARWYERRSSTVFKG
ncbi:GntR family transcriptional regulator [Rhodococcus rhodochrous]|uniref:GntR family transcriptional regulator n=1 Tax=Rhodococcus rhodochrous TaxID=1829 RepID=UPI001E410582|nr:GntR family transcriptional regulator [Rhodococcus rhodochrous]MCD2097081.1 GntR family transcriptional regulator [Rhodococcus rhodochrous]MCD2120487.1 GntR family transcriptional regulator [Rhodococcus rhodochrous]MCQ4133041.1 GntR family transcriptional regulator [Rhodococcus rhodochrous]MDJ0017352.1 GntR family transcriptional regulator [Rhodococcus rhodochrous]